jgi:hypothetical protein
MTLLDMLRAIFRPPALFDVHQALRTVVIERKPHAD